MKEISFSSLLDGLSSPNALIGDPIGFPPKTCGNDSCLKKKNTNVSNEIWKAEIKKVKLPRSRIRIGWFRVPSLIGGRVFPRHAEFQALRAGPLLFLAFPAEIGSGTGIEIENQARARGFTPFVISPANDYIGYVIPRRDYLDRSQYESQASFYGEKMDGFVKQQAVELTENLTPQSR